MHKTITNKPIILGLKFEKSEWLLHLNHQDGDGYRENSRFQTTQFNLRKLFSIEENEIRTSI